MADITDVKSVNDLLSQVTEGFSHFFTNLEGTLEKLAGIPNLLNGSNDSLKKTTESAKDASAALDKTHEASENLLRNIIDVGSSAYDTFKAIASGSEEAVDRVGNLSDGITDVFGAISLVALGAPTAFNKFNEATKDASSNMETSLLPTFNKIIDKISETTDFPLLDKFKAFAGVAIPAVDSVNNLETSLLALHGSSGDLTKVFEDAGASETNLTKLTNEFNDSIKRVVENTGAAPAAVIGYTSQILKIPELYDKIINTNLSGNIGFVEAAMKVARGTTQDYADVMGIVNAQFENMNIKGQAPLELMSRMFSVSQTLKVPFNYISEQVKDVSAQFKFFGDNTQGALNIIEGLTPKLLASNLGPKATKELIGELTGAVYNLDIAQKSLLSSRTGGVGGLQGGFQIDQLLASGKVDEVYKKMEDALKQQFGGKVTTLKEGSESQAGAAQLQKEVAFLTQGPFGSLVKNSAEAYKLLESFKAGQAPTQAKTQEELTGGLSKTIDRGRNVEESQYTQAQKLSNETELFKMFSSKKLGEDTRGVVKTELTGLGERPTDNLKNRVDNAPDAKTAMAYVGAGGFKIGHDIYDKLADQFSKKTTVETKAAEEAKNIEAEETNQNLPTPIETNAAKPKNRNLTPTLPSTPDADAAEQRQNVLKTKPVPGTTLASHGITGDQTLTIKVVSTGLDGKTEERIMAKAQAQAIKLIETNKHNDLSSATVGH